MKQLQQLSELDRYRWVIRGLVVLVVVLALIAGLLQEELRLEHLKLVRLQNTVQNGR